MIAFDDFVKKHTTWLENEYVAGALTLFLIVYANNVAPTLPTYIAKLFSTQIFKLLMLFLIVYVLTKKATVALVSAIGLMIMMMLLNNINIEKSEKMTLTKTKNNDLLSNLTNLFNDAISTITSSEGQIVIEETSRAVQNGQLHPAEAEMIINKIILAEEQGVSPLIAISTQGAQEMQNIAQEVENGNIDEEDGKRMAAQIVIQENIVNIDQNQPLMSSQQEKQMLENEIKKQKENIERNTGTKMTQIQLRQLCAQIELDYYNQKMNEMNEIVESNEFTGFDNFTPLYENF